MGAVLRRGVQSARQLCAAEATLKRLTTKGCLPTALPATGQPGSALQRPPRCGNKYAEIRDTFSRVFYYLGCIIKKLDNKIPRKLIPSVGTISHLIMSHKF